LPRSPSRRPPPPLTGRQFHLREPPWPCPPRACPSP
jgi:hypothetical protein